MSRVPYISSAGSLMYVMVCIRPNISSTISPASRFMSNPGKLHWEVVDTEIC